MTINSQRREKVGEVANSYTMLEIRRFSILFQAATTP